MSDYVDSTDLENFRIALFRKLDKSQLSKRELFAAMAMQGLLASANGSQVTDDNLADVHPNKVVNQAVQIADALIAALNGESQ